jgi:predicted RNA-binding Zn-ribbon protein involved in translation (DUF1610 family)
MNHACPNCDISTVTSDIREQHFPYVYKSETVELTALVLVYTCNTCDFQWTDGEAEVARQAAVSTYLSRIPE